MPASMQSVSEGLQYAYSRQAQTGGLIFAVLDGAMAACCMRDAPGRAPCHTFFRGKPSECQDSRQSHRGHSVTGCSRMTLSPKMTVSNSPQPRRRSKMASMGLDLACSGPGWHDDTVASLRDKWHIKQRGTQQGAAVVVAGKDTFLSIAQMPTRMRGRETSSSADIPGTCTQQGKIRCSR